MHSIGCTEGAVMYRVAPTVVSVKALPAPPSQLPVIIASVLGKTLLIVLITVNDLHFNNKNTTNRIP